MADGALGRGRGGLRRRRPSGPCASRHPANLWHTRPAKGLYPLGLAPRWQPLGLPPRRRSHRRGRTDLWGRSPPTRSARPLCPAVSTEWNRAHGGDQRQPSPHRARPGPHHDPAGGCRGPECARTRRFQPAPRRPDRRREDGTRGAGPTAFRPRAGCTASACFVVLDRERARRLGLRSKGRPPRGRRFLSDRRRLGHPTLPP
jgi:hypothetical protein